MKTKLFALFIAAACVLAVAVPLMAAPPKPTLAQTADKITLSGDKAKKVASDKFSLSKDAWYIVRIEYKGADVSVCQLSLVTQKMIDDKTTVGGLLTNWMGPKTTEIVMSKGRYATGDFMLYVDQADGPWTVEILKNPKPAPLSGAKSFSGTTNKVTPFFRLNKGSASFTIHQKLKGRFSSRIQVTLFNADTGAMVTNLCRNSTTAEIKARADVPAAGAYLLEVSGGDSWDISYAQ